MPYSFDFDGLDVKILRALQANARVSVSRISKMTNSPHATIRLRIKRLEDRGVIKGYAPVLDLKELGYMSRAIVLIKTSPKGEYKDLAKTFREMKNVLWVYSIAGRMSGALLVVAKDMHDLHETVLNIRRVPGVVDEETIIVMDEVKEAGLPEFF